jgi:hypothetical protein
MPSVVGTVPDAINGWLAPDVVVGMATDPLSAPAVV